ncbi:MAG: hypothetical protein JW940_03600 [Polyangiaceae bacterium]|nr:hypothetical protein [Polyangiaceae bacterium]
MTQLSALSSVLLATCLAACTVETVSNDDDDNDFDNGAAGSEEVASGGATSETGGTSGQSDAGEPGETGGSGSTPSTQAGAAGRNDGGAGGEAGAAPAQGGEAGAAPAQGGEGGAVNAAGGAGGAGGAAGSAGAAQGGAAGSGEITIEDPAPFAAEPGETSECEDAPATDLTVFEHTDVTESTMTFEGTVTDASGPGTYYVSAGTQAISGTVPTDSSSGEFSVKLPLFCGEQTVKLVWTNEDCRVAAVSRVVRTGCDTDDIRLTLSWDELGDDFELHLIKPGGRINDNKTDCTWSNCIGAGPDWGVKGDTTDDPRKDVDDEDAYGPENIYYDGPEDGTYTVMVEHMGDGSSQADGKVIFNVAGRTYEASIENLAPGSVWTAGTIEWPGGEVTTSQYVYDCTATWSSGCKAEIP